MSKLPVVAGTDEVTPVPVDKAGEPVPPEERQPAPFGAWPFFGFSYSFHEITSEDGRTRVRSRQARLVDGKLQTEEFDGTLGAAAYAEAMARAQRLMAQQTSFLLRQFSNFLPFWGKWK